MRVVLAGAAGRMGQVVRPALEQADDVELVATLGRGDDAGTVLRDSRPEVLVDFTEAEASRALVAAAVERDVSPVIGTSGWPAAAVDDLAEVCRARALGALLVPNFSIGAVLQMRFAEAAARHLACTALEETHHAGKRDSPSATALRTAERMGAAGADVPPIASARRDGLVAEQVVRFGDADGAAGEELVLGHRVDDRRAYVPGVLIAVRRVRALDGLVVGLAPLLEGPGC